MPTPTSKGHRLSEQKHLILHVDDDEANRYAVTRSLTKAGFNVIEAANGAGALEKMEERPELVILDVRLPDIDGFEVCRRIKADPANASTPVLHLSASFITGEDKAHGLDGGADGYLVRPVEPVELIATVNALLRTKASEEALRKIEEQNAILIENLRLAVSERDALLTSERVARTEAERAGTMKDEFLATLSHELRTPLNAILGWSTILRTQHSDLNDDLRQGLDAIERNARAQTQIIEDLLDMSRIINGKVRLDVQRVDLTEVVKAAIETVKPTADAKTVRIKTILDPLSGTISGDGNRLQQVFWNLLTNAIRFTPKEGHVQVHVQQVESHIEVCVIDTGEGIKPDFLPFVFDRFRQADGTTTRRHGGLGLGLAIVKQLVELHGGGVRVDSQGIGKGSTFTVSLPMSPLALTTKAKEEKRSPQVPTAPMAINDACSKIAGLKAVVVDDEADARSVVSRFLESCGVVVLTAGSSEAAIELIVKNRPDILISDIGMPDEDGYTLIKRVRALGIDRGGTVPAIALTAYARSEDRTRSLLAGYQMHLSKPVEPTELIAMVASLSRSTIS